MIKCTADVLVLDGAPRCASQARYEPENCFLNQCTEKELTNLEALKCDGTFMPVREPQRDTRKTAGAPVQTGDDDKLLVGESPSTHRLAERKGRIANWVHQASSFIPPADTAQRPTATVAVTGAATTNEEAPVERHGRRREALEAINRSSSHGHGSPSSPARRASILFFMSKPSFLSTKSSVISMATVVDPHVDKLALIIALQSVMLTSVQITYAGEAPQVVQADYAMATKVVHHVQCKDIVQNKWS
jgi:hypothetical protein